MEEKTLPTLSLTPEQAKAILDLIVVCKDEDFDLDDTLIILEDDLRFFLYGAK